jgi:hypothetical protein
VSAAAAQPQEHRQCSRHGVGIVAQQVRKFFWGGGYGRLATLAGTGTLPTANTILSVYLSSHPSVADPSF